MNRKNVFIIHGHDEKNLETLASVLREFGLNPIVLMWEPNKGKTIIEKFESLAKKCDCAIALMTPDDLMAEDLHGEEVFRARQNLLLELGWFMAERGRRKTIILHRRKVEIPSDLLGVLYISFEETVAEIKHKLKRELKAIGSPV